MRKIEDWLLKEAEGWEVVGWVFAGAVAIVSYSMAISTFVSRIIASQLNSGHLQYVLSQPPYVIILMILAAAFIEEVIFRGLPTFFARRIFGERVAVILIIAVMSSVVFGWIHGGPIKVLMQGVCGFIFYLIFLKCGGMRGKYAKALIASTMTHALVNIIFWLQL